MTGSLAEVVSVPDDAVVPLPPDLGFPLAAGLGIAGLAGWMPVRERGALLPGETVVVLGAGGAVGQVAIQAARDGGAARVVGAARSDDGRERAVAAGADVAVPTGPGLAAALREVCREGADLVIDPLWGEAAVAAIGALRRGRPRRAGRERRRADRRGPRAAPSAAAAWTCAGSRSSARRPEDVARAYRGLADAAVRGAVTMNLVGVPLADAPEAWARVAPGAGGDKIVVAP